MSLLHHNDRNCIFLLSYLHPKLNPNLRVLVIVEGDHFSSHRKAVAKGVVEYDCGLAWKVAKFTRDGVVKNHSQGVVLVMRFCDDPDFVLRIEAVEIWSGMGDTSDDAGEDGLCHDGWFLSVGGGCWRVVVGAGVMEITSKCGSRQSCKSSTRTSHVVSSSTITVNACFILLVD